MENYYTVSEYAATVGKDTGNIRRLLKSGVIKGEKLGKQWIIPKSEVYPEDKRVKSGNYRNWRKKTNIYNSNIKLMKAVKHMCRDISDIYGEYLIKIVLYGSYARGEQSEESDLDIALFLSETGDSKKHDKMTDIVVDYELEQGVTLSVIPIDNKEYLSWRDTLPFYKNIDKEGIVLWKAG